MKRRTVLIVSAACLAVLVFVCPALAQDQTKSISAARAFLLPGDPIGLAITWMLVFFSALSIGYTLRLMLKYRRSSLLPERTRSQVVNLLAGRRYREAVDFTAKDPSYLGRVISAALSVAGHGYGAMERAIEEKGDAETTKILRPIEYLNVLGNIAPMVGLFGTVYGMILAFEQLRASGGKPDPGQLAGGISTAMVTTFWGLVVAIPALAAYALIRNKIDALTSEGMLIAEQAITAFKPNGPAQAQRPQTPTPPQPKATPQQDNDAPQPPTPNP